MAELPRPAPSPEGQPFFDYLKQGELRIQRCTGCDRLRHPPQPMCANCGSFQSEWAQVSGRGTIHSFIVSRQAIHPALVDRVPFATVSVLLDEGPRLISNLTNVEPDRIEIGMPVELDIVAGADGLKLPMFRAAPPASE